MFKRACHPESLTALTSSLLIRQCGITEDHRSHRSTGRQVVSVCQHYCVDSPRGGIPASLLTGVQGRWKGCQCRSLPTYARPCLIAKIGLIWHTSTSFSCKANGLPRPKAGPWEYQYIT